jgi:hypothetical protein
MQALPQQALLPPGGIHSAIILILLWTVSIGICLNSSGSLPASAQAEAQLPSLPGKASWLGDQQPSEICHPSDMHAVASSCCFGSSVTFYGAESQHTQLLQKNGAHHAHHAAPQPSSDVICITGGRSSACHINVARLFTLLALDAYGE